MDIVLTSENYISIAAVFVGVVSLIISYNISSRALKQSEENVRMQLIYNDQIMALKSLHEIIGSEKNYEKLKIKLENFVRSFEGSFLPQKTITLIHEELRKMDSYLYENDPTPKFEPSDEELEEMQYENYIAEKEQRESMQSWELFEEEFKVKMCEMKTLLKSNITKKVKKDV